VTVTLRAASSLTTAVAPSTTDAETIGVRLFDADGEPVDSATTVDWRAEW
jgi:hypothetical protein